MSRNLTFVVSFATGYIVFQAIALLILYSQLGIATYNSQWLHQVIKKKTYLCKSPQNKILFIGGSNVLFGINAKLVERTLKIKSVNFGLNAGLRMPYLLHLCSQGIHSGDVVVLIPEYENFDQKDEGYETLDDYVLARDGPYFRSLSLWSKIAISVRIPYDRLVICP